MLTNMKHEMEISEKTIDLSFNYCISEKMLLRLESLDSNGRLVWELTLEQKKFIEDFFEYSVNPYIYKVQTRKLRFTKNQPSILKRISKEAYKGKKFLFTSLKKEDMRYLKELEITIVPYKYEITKYKKI